MSDAAVVWVFFLAVVILTLRSCDFVHYETNYEDTN